MGSFCIWRDLHVQRPGISQVKSLISYAFLDEPQHERCRAEKANAMNPRTYLTSLSVKAVDREYVAYLELRNNAC